MSYDTFFVTAALEEEASSFKTSSVLPFLHRILCIVSRLLYVMFVPLCLFYSQLSVWPIFHAPSHRGTIDSLGANGAYLSTDTSVVYVSRQCTVHCKDPIQSLFQVNVSLLLITDVCIEYKPALTTKQIEKLLHRHLHGRS
jgi:hypothetical protein